MHDCPVADGDRWLASVVPQILGSNAWRDGGLLVITFDEAPRRDRDGRIPTLVVSPLVASGTTSLAPHDHYSLLRTIEEAWDMPCLGEACGRDTLAEFFSASDGAEAPLP